MNNSTKYFSGYNLINYSLKDNKQMVEIFESYEYRHKECLNKKELGLLLKQMQYI